MKTGRSYQVGGASRLLIGLHVDQFINRNVFVEGFGQIR